MVANFEAEITRRLFFYVRIVEKVSISPGFSPRTSAPVAAYSLFSTFSIASAAEASPSRTITSPGRYWSVTHTFT